MVEIGVAKLWNRNNYKRFHVEVMYYFGFEIMYKHFCVETCGRFVNTIESLMFCIFILGQYYETLDRRPIG